MADEIKINGIRKQFNIALMVSGMANLAGCFKDIAYETKGYSFFKDALVSIGITSATTSEMDINYRVANWSIWQEILSILNQILSKVAKYTPEIFDCDNFAYWVASNVPLLFGLNCPEVYGKFTNSTTGKEFMHHWNLIVDKDSNCYIYDGTSGNSCQIIKGQPIKMGLGTYEILTVKIF